MYHWYGIFTICLIHLLSSADAGNSMWTRVAKQNFEMSTCLFSNDSQRYFCHDKQNREENSAIYKLNTFKVTERLCEQSLQGSSCKNISLLFFKSQKAELCIASTSATTLKQIDVRLHLNSYLKYSPICVKSKSQLQHKNFTSSFSCTTDVDKMGELVFTVSGYDVTIDRVWNTALKINIVDHCNIFDNSDNNRDFDNKQPSKALLIEVVGIVLGIVGTVIFGFIILKRCITRILKQRRHQQYENEPLIQSTSNSILPLNELASNFLSDANSIDSDVSNMPRLQVVMTGQQANQCASTFLQFMNHKASILGMTSYQQAMIPSKPILIAKPLYQAPFL